eukprot:Skav228005  [mRNA]  locus=scaffold390:478769:481359:- [translate_table: standard]
MGNKPADLPVPCRRQEVSVEYAVLNVAGTERAADAPASDLGETSAGIDRSDDRFKDLPRDATIKEQLGSIT